MSTPRFENPFESDRINGTEDFCPAWDVPSLGQSATQAIIQDVEAVRAAPATSNLRKIHLIRGSAGVGKTHVIGRLEHRLGDQARILYIADVPDASRVLHHIRWQVTESLFAPGKDAVSPLQQLMARILRPSFAAYFDQLPVNLRSKTTEFRRALDLDERAVLKVLGRVTNLAPYQALAYSFIKRFPALPASVLRAFVLGLSPVSNEARSWLRGEAEQITEERLRALRLDPASPAPVDVLRATTSLLQLTAMPLVICLDQLDLLFLQSAQGFQELCVHLMSWLQTIPNLLVVLGCVDERWKEEILVKAALKAFVDRLREHHLTDLSPAQARDIISRRLRSWVGFDTSRGPGWPFDLPSVDAYVEKVPQGPRAFIKQCCVAFAAWRDKGCVGLIQMGQKPPAPINEWFVAEWAKRTKEVADAKLDPAHCDEKPLADAVFAALEIARLGQHVPKGVCLEKYQLGALTPGHNERPSAEVHLLVGKERIPVVLTLSKKDGGPAFGHWVNALENALGGHIAGALAVWPRNKLAVNSQTASYQKFAALENAGTVRRFGFDAHNDTFVQLETLRRLLLDAKKGEVLHGNKPLNEADCRKLIVDTGVLAHLPLFAHLFSNWPAIEKARQKVLAPAPVPVPAAPVPVAVTPVAAPAPAAAQPKPNPAPTATLTPPKPAPPPESAHTKASEMLATVVEKLYKKGQKVKPLGVEVGPTFIRLKLALTDDADFSKVAKQADNLRMYLSLTQLPIIATQAGYISVDVQRPDRQTVPLKSVLSTRPKSLHGQPAFPMGVDVTGATTWTNLADPATCHLLVGGTTGSGKSQLLKSMIAALAEHLSPSQVRFLLIDPKQVTFALPPNSHYLLRPVVHSAAGAIPLLEECCDVMETRYSLLSERGIEHIGELTGANAVPRWIIVCDEFADLMSDKSLKKDAEAFLCRLGAKARAAGIHLILGTQRPEASVVTPLLRSNLPGRVALQVPTEKDSKIILDLPDAAYLLDKGDMFFKRGGSLLRLQSPYLSNQELAEFVC